MSDDLVKRLRRDAEDVADEIERLRAERDAAYLRGYEAAREDGIRAGEAIVREWQESPQNTTVFTHVGAVNVVQALRAMQPKEASDD